MGNMRLKTRSDTGKVFISRVVRRGKAQTQFAEKIGRPVGACVKLQTENKSFQRSDQVKIIKDCMSGAGVKSGMTIGTIDPNSYYHRLKEGRVGGGQPV